MIPRTTAVSVAAAISRAWAARVAQGGWMVPATLVAVVRLVLLRGAAAVGSAWLVVHHLPASTAAGVRTTAAAVSWPLSGWPGRVSTAARVLALVVVVMRRRLLARKEARVDDGWIGVEQAASEGGGRGDTWRGQAQAG